MKEKKIKPKKKKIIVLKKKLFNKNMT